MMNDSAGEEGKRTMEGSPLPASTADEGRIAQRQKLFFIDTLRGIAILLVIIVHHGLSFREYAPLRWITEYGQLGVQLFFVASAFTLCLSVSSRRAEPHPTASFFIRRYFRIAPLYYLGILLYGALFFLSYGRDGIHNPGASYSLTNVLANMTFLHGFVPSANNGVVPGGWSIATEFNFYLIFPIIFPLLSFIHQRWNWIGLAGVTALLLLADILLLTGVSGWLGLPLENNSFLFYNIVNQLPVFFIGISGYLMMMKSGRFAPVAVRDSMTFAIMAILCAVILQNGSPLFTFLLPVIAGLSFLFLLNITRQFVVRIGTIERIGQVSFSMYIFHFLFAFPMTKIILLKVAPHVPGGKITLYVPTLLLTVALSVIVGYVSKVVIEDRFIDLGRQWIGARDARFSLRGGANQ